MVLRPHSEGWRGHFGRRVKVTKYGSLPIKRLMYGNVNCLYHMPLFKKKKNSVGFPYTALCRIEALFRKMEGVLDVSHSRCSTETGAGLFSLLLSVLTLFDPLRIQDIQVMSVSSCVGELYRTSHNWAQENLEPIDLCLILTSHGEWEHPTKESLK